MIKNIKILVSVAVLEWICMGAAGADTPNLASVERQSDGSYKVVCLDGTKETLTEKQFEAGDICIGLSISRAFLTSVPVGTEVEVVTNTIIPSGVSVLYFSNGEVSTHLPEVEYDTPSAHCEMRFIASNHERRLPKGFVFKVSVDAAKSAPIYLAKAGIQDEEHPDSGFNDSFYHKRVYLKTNTSEISSMVCYGNVAVTGYVSRLEYPSIANFYRHFAGTLYLRYNPEPEDIH